MFKTMLFKHLARSFGHWDFETRDPPRRGGTEFPERDEENLEIVSDFEIRISDLWITLGKFVNAPDGVRPLKPVRLPQR
jgi:hypothetical protein